MRELPNKPARYRRRQPSKPGPDLRVLPVPLSDIVIFLAVYAIAFLILWIFF